MARNSQSIAKEATAWLARRDRGFTPSEQDQFLEWLRRDPRHADVLAKYEKSWGRLDILAYRTIDPAALPPPTGRSRIAQFFPHRIWWFAAASAAALCAGFFAVNQRKAPLPATTSIAAEDVGISRSKPEQRVLSDGSIVDLKAGAVIDVVFEEKIRRVRLVSGEAHFKVAKNAARPFIVESNHVAVRAVGTAFSVESGEDQVAVLVSEGKVRVTSPTRSDSTSEDQSLTPTFLVAGQRTVVNTRSDHAPVIETITADELAQSLGWDGLQLTFDEIPLSKVAEEFNRYNQHKLLVEDQKTAAFLVAGKFRADNVEAFVRLANASWGLSIATRADGSIVLSLH